MASVRSFDEAMGMESSDFERDISTPPSRKRLRPSPARSTTAQEHDEQIFLDESDPYRPVLPDNFRRSPQNERPKFQPGSIVRVKLQNFVTYTEAEFHPGPNLNMVIGPNGTGKSTLVCAICLGLGWNTAQLGRAKDIGEFVKHGSAEATIVIELARDPNVQRTNPVITTRITKADNKTDFSIDGRRTTKKGAQELARSFSIQVDNLCQFLPQDRVVEFASLSDVALLAETQKAAAPEHMTQWHNELKGLGREMKEKSTAEQDLLEALKRLENRQRAQQADYDRIREHSSLQKRFTTLEKLKPFPLYTQKVNEYKEARSQRNRSLRQLERVQTQLEPSLRAVDDKAEYLENITAALESKKNVTRRIGEQSSSMNRNYETRQRERIELQEKHERNEREMKDVRASIAKISHDIQKIERDMQNEPPAVDFAAYNAEIREYTRQIRAAEVQQDTIQERLRELRGQIDQRRQRMTALETQKNNLNSQLGRQASKLAQASEGTSKAWQWVQEHMGEFKETVYGPPIITCSVNDSRVIAAIETVLGKSSLLALTATNEEDYDRLQAAMHQELHLGDLTLRNVMKPLEFFKPPCPVEHILQHGLEGYLLDKIEGPEPVLAMLCDNSGLDAVGYTTGVLDTRQLNGLKDTGLTSWVTSREHASMSRRREYGDHAVSTKVVPLQPARYFTDAPVDHELERTINRQLNELREECETLKQEGTAEQARLVEIRKVRQEIAEKKTSKENEKAAHQTMRTAYDALPIKRDGLNTKLTEARAKIDNYVQARRQHDEEIDRIYLAQGQIALDYARSIEQFRLLHAEVLEMELMQIEARSDHEQLSQRYSHDTAQLAQHQQDVAKLTESVATLRTEAQALHTQCTQIGLDLDEDEKTIQHEVTEMTPDELDNEIQSMKARLELNTGGNHRVVAEFESREKQIQDRKSRLDSLRVELDTMRSEIDELRQRWEPLLEEIVSKISASFADNFASIQCAGEVGLYKEDDNFEQWAIHIKVKFREQESLSKLDSHRQSGGERAVSTIFYLMALQSLARAPFRVVDEINQGMDPRNERMVHSRLVSIACQSAREGGGGGSQYFLITPKLLNGLEYHPNMKVHCIASGEWMPRDHSSLDFQQLAQKALAVQAASS